MAEEPVWGEVCVTHRTVVRCARFSFRFSSCSFSLCTTAKALPSPADLPALCLHAVTRCLQVMLRAIAQDNEEDLLAALDLPGVDIKEGIVESDVEDRDTSVSRTAQLSRTNTGSWQ